MYMEKNFTMKINPKCVLAVFINVLTLCTVIFIEIFYQNKLINEFARMNLDKIL